MEFNTNVNVLHKGIEGFRRMSSQYLYTDSLLPMVADSAPLVKSLQCKWSDSLHYSLGINVKSCKLGPY